MSSVLLTMNTFDVFQKKKIWQLEAMSLSDDAAHIYNMIYYIQPHVYDMIYYIQHHIYNMIYYIQHHTKLSDAAAHIYNMIYYKGIIIRIYNMIYYVRIIIIQNLFLFFSEL